MISFAVSLALENLPIRDVDTDGEKTHGITFWGVKREIFISIIL
jgi:hypothetical protein